MSETNTADKKRTEDAKWLTDFVIRRDENAFAQLVRKYENLVWVICRRVLQNRCDAEDAFQATFEVLASKAKGIRKPKSIASWIYGVAFRTANSIRRQRRREPAPYSESIDPRSESDVLEHVSAKNEIEIVGAELWRLAEKYRTPLLLFYFLGHDARQIANTLDLSVSAVESRLRRGRAALKSRLLIRGIEARGAAIMFVAPGISVSSTLSTKAITAGMAVQVGGVAAQLINRLSILNQTGVKLMILKSGIAFSLIALLGMGFMMHSGTFAKTSVSSLDLQETFVNESPNSQAEAIVNLEQDQDDSKKHKNHKEHEHLDQIHRHIHHHFMSFFFHLHGVHPKPHDKGEDLKKQHHHQMMLHHHKQKKSDKK